LAGYWLGVPFLGSSFPDLPPPHLRTLSAFLVGSVGFVAGRRDYFNISLRLRTFRALDYPEAAIAIGIGALLFSVIGLVPGAAGAHAMGTGSRRVGAIFGAAAGAVAGGVAGAGFARWQGWPLLAPGCFQVPPRGVAAGAGRLRVRRAREPTDIIWSNLSHAGTAWRAWLMPFLTWTGIATLLYVTGSIVLSMTAVKLRLAGKQMPEEEGGAADGRFWDVSWFIDAVLQAAVGWASDQLSSVRGGMGVTRGVGRPLWVAGCGGGTSDELSSVRGQASVQGADIGGQMRAPELRVEGRRSDGSLSRPPPSSVNLFPLYPLQV
jgi:hypothetical protein